MRYFVASHPLIAAQVTYRCSVEPSKSFPDPAGLPDYVVRRGESQPAQRGERHPKTIDINSKTVKNIGLNALALKAFFSISSSGASLGKTRPADVCLCVCVCVCVWVWVWVWVCLCMFAYLCVPAFLLWSPNSWSDQDKRGSVQCAGSAFAERSVP